MVAVVAVDLPILLDLAVLAVELEVELDTLLVLEIHLQQAQAKETTVGWAETVLEALHLEIRFHPVVAAVQVL